MNRIFLSLIVFLLAFSTSVSSIAAEDYQDYQVNRILNLEIKSSINPATLNYIKNGIEKAKGDDFQLILININTPGGLVSTTKEILTEFGESDIPIAIWVRPEGASATSAGAIIASGAHILVMSDGTNIGAATPIHSGGDIKGKDLRAKAVNDLVALVSSLANARGRNKVGFSEMITMAKSYGSRDALKNNLVDGIINTSTEFKSFINGRKINVKGKPLKIVSSNVHWVDLEMDWGQKLLNIFADPSLAYILFLIGAALLYLELQAPGGFIAGSIGAVCLLLAGIGFQVLPLNFGALGLIVLAFILFVLEAYITSYGILTIAGLASLVSGSMFLFRTNDAYLELSSTLIFSAVAAVVTFMVFLLFVILKDQKNIGTTKFNSLEGKKGQIIEELSSENEGEYYFHIKVAGEVWRAHTTKKYNPGDWVEVLIQEENSIILKI